MSALDKNGTLSEWSLNELIAQKLLNHSSGKWIGYEVARGILEDHWVVNISEQWLEYYLWDDVLAEIWATDAFKNDNIHQAYSKISNMSIPDTIEDTTQDVQYFKKLKSDLQDTKNNLDALRNRFTTQSNIEDVLEQETKQNLITEWKQDLQNLEQAIEDAQDKISKNNDILAEKDDPKTDLLPKVFRNASSKNEALTKDCDRYRDEIDTLNSYFSYENMTSIWLELEQTQSQLAQIPWDATEIKTSWEKTKKDVTGISTELKLLRESLDEIDEKNQQKLSEYLNNYDISIAALDKYLQSILDTEADFVKVMDGLSDIANSQDITNISPELKKTLKSEKAYDIANRIQFFVSGWATALGLFQITPKYLYEKSLFLGADGTPSTAAVYAIAWLAGVWVGWAGSAIFRWRAKKWIQAQAMKRTAVWRDHSFMKSLQGAAQWLFLNVNDKLSVFRTVTSAAAMAVLFGTIVPTEDGGIKNAASVPSNMSGFTTLQFWEQVRNTTKEQVVEAAINGTVSVEQIQADIDNTQNNISQVTKKYVDTEIWWGWVNNESGIGPVANIKHKIIHGKYLNNSTNSKYTKILEWSRFENSSFDDQLAGINTKYESKIDSFFDIFDVDDFDDELTQMLESANPFNLLTMSLDLKNKQVQTSSKFDTLTQDIENYIEELNTLGADVKSMLTKVERTSWGLRPDEQLSDKFIPKIKGIDITAIQQAKTEIQSRLSELDPFIVDVEAALAKTTNHSKELFYGIAIAAILVEIFGLLVLGPIIYRWEQKRFDKIADRLEHKYRDLIEKSKSHDLLPANANPLPPKLFSGKVIHRLPDEKWIKKIINNVKGVFQQWSVGNQFQNYAHNTNTAIIEIIKGALVEIWSIDVRNIEWSFNAELAKSYLHDWIEMRDDKVEKKKTPNEKWAADIEDLTTAIRGDNTRNTVEKLMIPNSWEGRVANFTKPEHVVLETIQNKWTVLNEDTKNRNMKDDDKDLEALAI